jgi:hypothetical protein
MGMGGMPGMPMPGSGGFGGYPGAGAAAAPGHFGQAHPPAAVPSHDKPVSTAPDAFASLSAF